jgi:hypothetical protein
MVLSKGQPRQRSRSSYDHRRTRTCPANTAAKSDCSSFYGEAPGWWALSSLVFVLVVVLVEQLLFQ